LAKAVEMNDVRHREQRLKDILTILSLLIIMLAGSGLFLGSLVWEHGRTDWSKIGQEGMKELGLSLLEAGLVILLIERRSAREQRRLTEELVKEATSETRRLIEESTKSLFNAVYKQNVPKPIIQHYEDNAFRSRFFRSKHEYTCTFHDDRWNPAPEGMIWVTFDQSFVMHNQSEVDQDFALACETEVLPQSQLPDEARSKCGFTSFRAGGKDILNESRTDIEDKGSYKAYVLRHSARIPGKGSKEFKITFKNLRKIDDFEVVMALCPSDGIALSLHYPSWLEISVVSLHPKELEFEPTDEYSAKWKLESGILTGQGVCL
jgi:hypothetical protein